MKTKIFLFKNYENISVKSQNIHKTTETTKKSAMCKHHLCLVPNLSLLLPHKIFLDQLFQFPSQLNHLKSHSGKSESCDLLEFLKLVYIMLNPLWRKAHTSHCNLKESWFLESAIYYSKLKSKIMWIHYAYIYFYVLNCTKGCGLGCHKRNLNKLLYWYEIFLLSIHIYSSFNWNRHYRDQNDGFT